MAVHPADAQAYIAHMANGGYRPNRYRVTLTGDLEGIDPSLSARAKEQFQFLAVSAQLPQSTIGIASTFYFGREVKFAGDKTFDDWTIEVYDDGDGGSGSNGVAGIRTFLENWHDNILGFETNLALNNYRKPLTYYLNGMVECFDREGNLLRTYEMRQIFPSSVGEIALSYENNNQIARFPVTFAVNYFMPVNNGTNFQRLGNGRGAGRPVV